MGRIVVGVDGSAGSRAALEWAVDQARLRQDRVEAVMVWQDPPTYLEVPATWSVDRTEIEEATRTELREAIGALGDHGVDQGVHGVVSNGRAAPILLHRAEGADLLVVGTRGHGGFAGVLLGSVSLHVVSHSPCPVVVVPRPEGDQ